MNTNEHKLIPRNTAQHGARRGTEDHGVFSLKTLVFFAFICGSFIVLGGQTAPAPVPRLPKVGILPTAPNELFTVELNAKPFTNSDAKIESLAPELVGLNGVRIPLKDPKVELDSRAPVQLLIAIFRGQGPQWTPPLNAKPLLLNAAVITTMPPLDVYLLDFDKGKRTLTLRGTYAILGVIPAGVTLPPHDAKGGTK